MLQITITVTNGEAARFATVVGRIKRYVDKDAKPRIATEAECKLYVIELMREKVIDIEEVISKEAAISTSFNPT